MGLYTAALKKSCLFFMPKELKHKNEIKAVLHCELINLRTYNTDPRAPSEDRTSTRGHAMPGLILDKSEEEGGEISSDVIALQAKDSCFFCKKTSHQKKDCRSYEDWKKKKSN